MDITSSQFIIKPSIPHSVPSIYDGRAMFPEIPLTIDKNLLRFNFPAFYIHFTCECNQRIVMQEHYLLNDINVHLFRESVCLTCLLISNVTRGSDVQALANIGVGAYDVRPIERTEKQ